MKNSLKSLRTWAEVDLDALLRNHRAFRAALPEGTRCAVVVKADAYGHGARRVAHLLEREADYFAVAMTDEALELRMDGITTPILILGHTAAEDADALGRNNIDTTVSSLAEAAELSREAVRAGVTVGVHIALDTGMSRIGFPCTEAAVDEIEELAGLPGLELRGIFSHYAAADSADLTYTRRQTEAFRLMSDSLEARGVSLPIKHICNSAGAVGDGEKFDMAREGILLYGLAPSEETDLSRLSHREPAMALRTHVTSLRVIPAGTPVSYGCTFVAERESVIATIQAGYADGVSRALSNSGEVLIRGKRAPIAGRVCMDQMMVDVTDIPDAAEGDVATIFGTDGGETVSAEDIAALTGTIGYEIICGISKRVPRVYLKKGEEPEVIKGIAVR